MDAGWDFGAFYGRPASALKSSIAEHEALVYRPLASSSRSYEHTAMVSEMLRRLRPKTGMLALATDMRAEISTAMSSETKGEVKEEEEEEVKEEEEEEAKMAPVNVLDGVQVGESKVMTTTSSDEQNMIENNLVAVENELSLFKQKAMEFEAKFVASEKEVERLRASRSHEGEQKSSTTPNTTRSATQNTSNSIRMQWEPDESSSSCTLCQMDFNFWRRRHHCRSCGCLCCSSCGPTRMVDNSAKTLRVCKNCAGL